MRNRAPGRLRRFVALGGAAAIVLFFGACSTQSGSAGPPVGDDAGDAGPVSDGAADATVDATDAGQNPVDSPAPWGDGVDGPGADILIADQFNNRVVEIDWTGTIVWTFGDGSTTPGPTSVVAPNDAERLQNGDTLICGSGLGAGSGSYGATEPPCAAQGCPDNRVLIVDKNGVITWQYGQDGGVSGSGPDELDVPVGAQELANGNILITDQGNNRIIEVARSTKSIVWQFPAADADGAIPQTLNSPNSAQRLSSGNTLIADENNNRVIEVDPTGAIVWSYPSTPAPQLLTTAAFASRLPNGNTLITDSGNSRVLEVTPSLVVTVVYNTAMRAGSFPQPFPAHAMRLADGNTLIADQLNDQVIEVDPKGQLVFSYGAIQLAGKAVGQLSAPYDAKVIGDYTGLSTPN